MHQRVRALRSLVANHHAPFGFRGTLEHLNEKIGTRSTRRWTEQELLRALDELEHSRATHVHYRDLFAERRRAEKAHGLRRPTGGDVEALCRTEWLKEPDEARHRHPSRRDRKRGM